MKKLSLLLVVAVVGTIFAGCNEKTPEEIEAAKYPKLKPLTPDEKKALDAKLGHAVAPPPGTSMPGPGSH